jgi:hypothetical protein
MYRPYWAREEAESRVNVEVQKVSMNENLHRNESVYHLKISAEWRNARVKCGDQNFERETKKVPSRSRFHIVSNIESLIFKRIPRRRTLTRGDLRRNWFFRSKITPDLINITSAIGMANKCVFIHSVISQTEDLWSSICDDFYLRYVFIVRLWFECYREQ